MTCWHFCVFYLYTLYTLLENNWFARQWKHFYLLCVNKNWKEKKKINLFNTLSNMLPSAISVSNVRFDSTWSFRHYFSFCCLYSFHFISFPINSVKNIFICEIFLKFQSQSFLSLSVNWPKERREAKKCLKKETRLNKPITIDE